jgi:hypothetical protein
MLQTLRVVPVLVVVDWESWDRNFAHHQDMGLLQVVPGMVVVDWESWGRIVANHQE